MREKGSLTWRRQAETEERMTSKQKQECRQTRKKGKLTWRREEIDRRTEERLTERQTGKQTRGEEFILAERKDSQTENSTQTKDI